jgi:hypothetical protein
VPYLALIVQEIPLATVVLASTFQSPEFIARMRAALHEEQRSRFDALRRTKVDANRISEAQDAILQALCEVLISGRFRLD